MRELIEARASQKLEWVKKRLINICIGVDSIAGWDDIQSSFLQKVFDCQKKYPITNQGAFIKLVN
jgi:hypothetical protein